MESERCLEKKEKNLVKPSVESSLAYKRSKKEKKKTGRTDYIRDQLTKSNTPTTNKRGGEREENEIDKRFAYFFFLCVAILPHHPFIK